MRKRRELSLGTNAFLNGLRSALTIIFPLITYPYAFRVLHQEMIGRVSYAQTIIKYIGLIATLGITDYAVREGAKVRDDRRKVSELASEIFTLNLVSTAVAYLLLVLCLLAVKPWRSYAPLLWLLSLSMAFKTFGVDWVNNVFEDFLYITIRSAVCQVIMLVLLFLLVRSERDYYIYASLTVLSEGIVCVCNWLYCRRYVHLRPMPLPRVWKHFKSVMAFFATTLTTTIYVYADVLMIGWICGDGPVGLYGLATQVYISTKTLLASVYNVVIPRISLQMARRDEAGVRRTYTDVFSNLTLLLLPAACGLIVVSREIVLLVGGSEYLPAVTSLQILSVAMIGAIYGGLVTYCLNIPAGRERWNVVATLISSCINVVLNVFLIPVWRQNGAAVTTVISEFFVFIFAVAIYPDFWRYLDRRRWLRSLLQALAGVATIYIVNVAVRSAAAGRLVLGIAGSTSDGTLTTAGSALSEAGQTLAGTASAASTNLLAGDSIRAVLIRLALIIILSISCYAGELLLMHNEFAWGLVRKLRREE